MRVVAAVFATNLHRYHLFGLAMLVLGLARIDWAWSMVLLILGLLAMSSDVHLGRLLE